MTLRAGSHWEEKLNRVVQRREKVSGESPAPPEETPPRPGAHKHFICLGASVQAWTLGCAERGVHVSRPSRGQAPSNVLHTQGLAECSRHLAARHPPV